ncbi:hypothetical protein [Pseudomonas juntendi]|uniref:Uncharacterized protein n=1 Tax=Pseudomonas juntendi TaxID=2666183 RepID=A0A7W2JM51_9PSED|nr:hypothetical protein [Pseudomonas juntendi]MBA6061509.1 hypothetical protein [Pseudomonas juntendi]
MNSRVAIVAISVVLCTVLIYAIITKLMCETLTFTCDAIQPFQAFYADKLRASLFAGFLTVGSFLMSLKTFIIVNMKKEVFDTQGYKEKFAKANSGKLYDPLKQLSDMLFATIVTCIIASISQLTIGLIPTVLTSIIPISIAIMALILLSWSLYLIRKNLESMFEHIGSN